MTNGVGAKKLCYLSLTTALGLLAFLIESAFPPLLFPGAKMGISNVFTLATLLLYGWREGVLVTLARTVLGSLFAGNLTLVLYSLTAGLASLLASELSLTFFPKISLVCISVLSAVTHNLTQLITYCALSGTARLFQYSPYLILLGAVAGLIVGLSVRGTIKAIPLSVLEKWTKQGDHHDEKTHPFSRRSSARS